MRTDEFDPQRIHLLKKYGIGQSDFDEMLRAQDGRCAICRADIWGRDAEGRIKARVDHDHTTNLVRALLCGTCNSGLGMFKDSIRNLAAAIVYLEDHGKSFS